MAVITCGDLLNLSEVRGPPQWLSYIVGILIKFDKVNVYFFFVENPPPPPPLVIVIILSKEIKLLTKKEMGEEMPKDETRMKMRRERR